MMRSSLHFNGVAGEITVEAVNRVLAVHGLTRSQVDRIVVSGDVGKIGDYAFAKFENVSYIFLPESVTLLAKYAFYQCKSLQTIDVRNVASIPECAFYECRDLATVQLKMDVATIGDHAFAYCFNLRTLYPYLCGSTTFIAATAFLYCWNLLCIRVLGGASPPRVGFDGDKEDSRGVLRSFDEGDVIRFECVFFADSNPQLTL